MPESSFLNPTKVVSAAHIAEGMQVADFGAGSGFFTRAAAREVGEQGAVWAVDAHRDLLPRLKTLAEAEGLHQVEVVCGDCELPGGSGLPAEHFDLVIVANILFAAEDKAGLAAEAARVLRRGGRALIIDWSGSFGGLGPHSDHVVRKESAQKLFERAGFSYIEDLPAGAYHWGMLMKKTSTMKQPA